MCYGLGYFVGRVGGLSVDKGHLTHDEVCAMMEAFGRYAPMVVTVCPPELLTVIALPMKSMGS